MIPGDPDAIEAAADGLTAAADRFATARDTIVAHARAMSTEWTGRASQLAQDRLEAMGARALIGRDVTRGSAPPLRRYAAELRSAQRHYATAEQHAANAQAALAGLDPAGAALGPPVAVHHAAAKAKAQADLTAAQTAMNDARARAAAARAAAATQIRDQASDCTKLKVTATGDSTGNSSGGSSQYTPDSANLKDSTYRPADLALGALGLGFGRMAAPSTVPIGDWAEELGRNAANALNQWLDQMPRDDKQTPGQEDKPDDQLPVDDRPPVTPGPSNQPNAEAGHEVDQLRRKAHDDAKLIERHLRNGTLENVSPVLLQRIDSHAHNEVYAAAFLNELGMDDLLILSAGDRVSGVAPYFEGQTTSSQYSNVVANLAVMLGLATNGIGYELTRSHKNALIRAAGSNERIDPQERVQYAPAKFQSMSRLIDLADLHGEFLLDVAERLYDRQEELDGPPTYPEFPDPMVVVFHGLSNDPSIARRFFDIGGPNGDGMERVRTLMLDYTGHEKVAEQLSSALRAASMDGLSGDRSEGTKEHHLAAAIASQYLHTAALDQKQTFIFGWKGDTADFAQTSPQIKRDVARVMAFYYEDVRTALRSADNLPYSDTLGVYEGTHDESPTNYAYHPKVSSEDVKALAGEVWDDAKAKQALLTAAAAREEAELAQRAEAHDDRTEHQLMNGYADRLGQDLEDLYKAGYSDEREAALTQAERHEAYAAISEGFTALLTAGTSSSPTGLAGSVIAEATNEWLQQGIEDSGMNLQDVERRIKDDQEAYEFQRNKVIVGVMIRQGLWPKDEMPDDYVESEDLPDDIVLFRHGSWDIHGEKEVEVAHDFFEAKNGLFADYKSSFDTSSESA